MLDIDSRPLIEPMNDLSIMSGLGPPPPFEGPGANRFAGRCTEFDLTNGFRTNFDKAEMPPLFEVIRCLLRDSVIDLLIFAVDRDTRVTNVLNRCKLDHKTSVLNSMSGVLRGFRVCGDSEVVGQMADFLEKAT